MILGWRFRPGSPPYKRDYPIGDCHDFRACGWHQQVGDWQDRLLADGRCNAEGYVDLRGAPVALSLVTTTEDDHRLYRDSPNWDLVGEVFLPPDIGLA